MTAAYKEIGQLCFGNHGEDCDLGDADDFVSKALYVLAAMVAGWDDYADSVCAFRNDTFTMRPYYWGECDCVAADGEACKPTCSTQLPNFVCGDFRVSWYKRIGRGMACNRPVKVKEAIAIMRRCFASMVDDA